MEFDRDSSWNLSDRLGYSFEQDVDAVQTDVIRLGDLVAFASVGFVIADTEANLESSCGWRKKCAGIG